MPLPGIRGSCSASQARRSAWFCEHDRIEFQGVARERAAQDRGVLAELVGDVGDDAVVGGGGRGEDRHVRVEQREDPADPAVVGPEVVAPVGDAVRLVDDEQADRALDRRAGCRS